MNSLSLTADITLTGLATGTAGNGNLKSGISVSSTAELTSSGTGATLASKLIDEATESQTVGAGGTVAIDLSSFASVLGETGQAVTAVRVLYFEHRSTSLASSISVFNAAANSFQGPVSAAATLTLRPGEDATLRSQTVTGWVVDGTHVNFLITNNDGANAATIRYLISGS